MHASQMLLLLQRLLAPDLTLGLRLPPEKEALGLDEHEHGESLYKGAGLKVWLAMFTSRSAMLKIRCLRTSAVPSQLAVSSGFGSFSFPLLFFNVREASLQRNVA